MKIKNYIIGASVVLGIFFASVAFALVSLPPSVQRGDLLVATSTTNLSRLPTSTNGYVLTMMGGIPTWALASSTGGSTLSAIAPIVYNSSTGQFSWINSNGYLTAASSNLLYYPLNSNPAGYVTSTGGGGSFSATGTIDQILVFTSTSTGIGYSGLSYASGTNTLTAGIFQPGSYVSLDSNGLHVLSGSVDQNGKFTASWGGDIQASYGFNGRAHQYIWTTGDTNSGIIGIRVNDVDVLDVASWGITVIGSIANSGGENSFASTSFAGNVTTTGNLVVQGNLLDLGGNKYVTSTGGGGSPTSTINGFKGIVFDLLGINGVTSTVTNGSTTFSLVNSGATAGSYTNTNLTVDNYGRITTASNGTGGSGVAFLANGGAFLTTSTINFQQGTNITITTSSNGTYTITGTTGGGSGSVSTSSAITAFNFPYWANETGGLNGTSTLFYSSSTGNIGIGTTTPAYALSVNGIVNATDFYKNGSPFTTSQWTTSGSNIYYNGGNVGIGTTGSTLGLLQLEKASGNDVDLALNQNGVSHWRIRNIATGGNLGIYNGQLGTIAMTIDKATGNVGIGTTQPSSTLHVAGGGIFTGNVTSTSLTDAQGNKYSTSTGVGFVPQVLSVQANSATGDVITSAQASNTQMAFTTSYTFPPNFFTAGRTVEIGTGFQDSWSTSAPNSTFRAALRTASATTTILTFGPNIISVLAASNIGFGATYSITALTSPATNASLTVACISCGTNYGYDLFYNTISEPVAIDTTTSTTLIWTRQFSKNLIGNSSTLIYMRVEEKW